MVEQDKPTTGKASTETKPALDPVDEASRESFPGSDAPGWVSQRAEDLENAKLDAEPMELLKHLATSEDFGEKAHYQAILRQRDQVLTQALTETAQALLKASGYTAAPKASTTENDERAIGVLADYLTKSSISETDQHLLALVGTGTLFGMKVEIKEEDDTLLLAPTDERGLDYRIVMRLARALDRSPEQEPLLTPKIDAAIKLPNEDAGLVKASIRALLDEVPMNTLENSMGKMIVDSVPGG